MKHIVKFSVLILALFSNCVYAQTFNFQRIDPLYIYVPLDSPVVENHGVVTNLTSSSFNITIRITYNVPTTWLAGICTWTNCYGAFADSIINVCPPGRDTMYAYFYPDSQVVGSGCMTITVKRTSNPSENYTQTFCASTGPIGIKQLSNTVETFNLNQNYPNPFNPSTKIGFSIPKTDFVDLRVYDILGREVKTLLSQHLNSGEYEIEFDAKNLASGMYYYRLQSGDNVSVKKMTLVK